MSEVIEERLQQTTNTREQGDLRQRIGPQHSGGLQPKSGRSEQWTVDPFWEMDRPTPVNHADRPGPSTTLPSQQELFAPMPTEESEIESDGPRPVSTRSSRNQLGTLGGGKERAVCQNGSCIKSHGNGRKQLGLFLGQAVKETERNLSTDLQLLMNETTNDPTLLKTLVCLERQQHEQIPDEYLPHKKKLSTRFGLVFIEDKIIVPKNLRTTIISLLHKGHPANNKMTTAARQFWWPKMTEAIQKKCESCIPCKMSGRNIKPNIPSTEKNNLPRLDNPNEEVQLDFIGPITVDNRRFHILLSMDRFSKWPAASFCTSTDGETAIKFLEQYILLNGVPITIRTDKATAFMGRLFRNFCKEHYIKLIYGTPYIHTPTGLVERGVRKLKENLLTNIKAGERLSKALDLSVDVMRKTPHSRLNKTAFELHYGRKRNTEISNLLKLDNLKELTNHSVSAKPDTLQVYSFNGAGASNYPFLFLEKEHQGNKFESAYSDKPQLAVSGTKHTVTTPNGRILHRKMISQPISKVYQEQNNRGIGPRGPDGRFIRSPSKP